MFTTPQRLSYNKLNLESRDIECPKPTIFFEIFRSVECIRKMVGVEPRTRTFKIWVLCTFVVHMKLVTLYPSTFLREFSNLHNRINFHLHVFLVMGAHSREYGSKKYRLKWNKLPEDHKFHLINRKCFTHTDFRFTIILLHSHVGKLWVDVCCLLNV